ncbi:MAG: sensor histidine kinase [Chitinophagia bacterium]|jgi:two-component system sensor histidine kinase CiaH
MRKLLDRIPLRFVNLIYWLLLAYLIAALAWWYFELDQQNDRMLALQQEQMIKDHGHDPIQLAMLQDAHQRNASQYIGEGLTFLILTLAGAFFVYNAVRRQIRLHQQQRNFMMAVTHELKTPIAVTKLNLETLKRHQLDEEKRSKIVSDAINETERLDALCNNILLSSQLESGGYQFSLQEFDASQMVSAAVKSFASRFPQRNFECQVPENLILMGEEFLLRLVLNNLLENGIKYAPAELPLTISLLENADTIELRVADLGAGIPDEEKSRVFDKFYRLEDESRRKTKGTGLGLYLSTKIVQDHKGKLILENNNPQGSVFKVILPKSRTT